MEERPPVPERCEGLLKGPRSISPSTFAGCLSAQRCARRSGRPTFYPGATLSLSLCSPRPRDHFKVLVLCLVREGLGRRARLGGRAGGGPETAGSKQPCVLWDHWALGRNPPPLCAFSRGERAWGFSSFPFSSFSFTPGDISSAPLNSARHLLFPGTHPKIRAAGRFSDYVRLGGGKGRKEGCDL